MTLNAIEGPSSTVDDVLASRAVAGAASFLFSLAFCACSWCMFPTVAETIVSWAAAAGGALFSVAFGAC